MSHSCARTGAITLHDDDEDEDEKQQVRQAKSYDEVDDSRKAPFVNHLNTRIHVDPLVDRCTGGRQGKRQGLVSTSFSALLNHPLEARTGLPRLRAGPKRGLLRKSGISSGDTGSKKPCRASLARSSATALLSSLDRLVISSLHHRCHLYFSLFLDQLFCEMVMRAVCQNI